MNFGRDLTRDSRSDRSVDVVVLQPSIALRVPPSSPAPAQAESGIGDEAFRIEESKALQGDKHAAFRVAAMFREGSNGVPRDEHKMLRWLRHSSELNNGIASYQLYLHYLNRGLDRDAVHYENRALQQGYVPPPRLDPRRG
jgi:TPR repeat protein